MLPINENFSFGPKLKVHATLHWYLPWFAGKALAQDPHHAVKKKHIEATPAAIPGIENFPFCIIY